MMRTRRRRALRFHRANRRLLGWMITSGAVVIVLSACSGTPSGDSAREAAQASSGSGRYKVGKPYQIKGVWYYPQIDYNYHEVGVASWYGPGFHGEKTANGETYDMNALTAAHRTLPLPSVVRVTNLENGRSLKLTVNDRGPYVGGRIIDVSRRASQLLGFNVKGTTMVDVQIDAQDSIALARSLGAPSEALVMGPSTVPSGPVLASSGNSATPVVGNSTIEPVADSPVATMDPIGADEDAVANASAAAGIEVAPLSLPDAGASGRKSGSSYPSSTPVATMSPIWSGDTPRYYVQAGAFSDPGRADRARARLATIGPAHAMPSQINGQWLTRVRVGPFYSNDEADRVLASVSQAGFPDSRVVSE